MKLSSFATLAATLLLAACTQPPLHDQETMTVATTTAIGQSAQPEPSVITATLVPGLYELALSSRENLLYVASAGVRGKKDSTSKLMWLDPDTLAVRGELKMDRAGFGLALDDAAGRLYVSNATDGSVTVIDTRAKQVLKVIQLASMVERRDMQTGQLRMQPEHNFRELVLDAAAHRLYMPGLWLDDSALYVIDTRTLEKEKVIPGFGFVATGITLDGTGAVLYVSNLVGQIYTVDTRTLTIRSVAEVDGDQLLNLAYDSKHGHILAVDQGFDMPPAIRAPMAGTGHRQRGNGNRVAVIDPVSGDTVEHLATGKGPVALLLDEKRNRLFVTNRDSGTVTVYDADSHELLHTIALPPHPNSLALDPDTGTVYVTVKNTLGAPGSTKESVARIGL